HAVAKDVHLRANGRGHFFLACYVSVQRIVRDRGNRQRHRQQVGPGAAPKQADGGKAHRHAQQGPLVGRPFKWHGGAPPRALADLNGNWGAICSLRNSFGINPLQKSRENEDQTFRQPKASSVACSLETGWLSLFPRVYV